MLATRCLFIPKGTWGADVMRFSLEMEVELIILCTGIQIFIYLYDLFYILYIYIYIYNIWEYIFIANIKFDINIKMQIKL